MARDVFLRPVHRFSRACEACGAIEASRARLRRRTRRLAPIWRDDSTGNGSRCASDASEGARVTLETSAAVRGDADARRGARRGAVANAIFKLETR
jgi:hypothetical protein